MLVSRLHNQMERRAYPLTVADLDNYLDRLMSGATSATGISITPDNALASGVVYACVKVLAEDIASLPLIVYRRLPNGGKVRGPEHRLYSILHDQANPYMTSVEFRACLVGQMLLWGNAYAEIERSDAGINALWPLRADCMTPVWDTSGSLAYKYRLPDGSYKVFLFANIMHWRGLSSDGIRGYSPITTAPETVALDMAAREYGARFYGNDSRPGGILVHPKTLTKDAAKRIKDSWEAAHGGLSNAQRVAVLEEGVQWQQVGVPPDAAQFLESRKYQRSEIAGMYRMPAHMINDLEKATFSNVEHLSIDYVKFTVRPWLVVIEQAIKRDLFAISDGKRSYFAEHLVDGLLRGDTVTRAQALQTMRQNGIINADEWREIENMNPEPDGQGQIYLVPMNMVPTEQLINPPPPPAPAPPPPPPDQARGLRLVETRAGGSAERQRIAASYRRLIVDASQRILRREEADVMRQAGKMLGARGAADFLTWLKAFYADHPDFVGRAYLPIFQSLAEQIGASAAAQIHLKDLPDLETFVREYTATAASRYAWSSFNQLRQVLEEAQAAGENPASALQTRFDEWRDGVPGSMSRADKLAATHTVRAGNAVAKETWRRGGVKKLRWTAYGENCAFCQQLDGRIAGIEDVFVRGDEEFKSGDQVLQPRGNIGHAPLHLGCNCSVEPER